MRTDSFFFDLPQNLIAQHPPEERGQSRLMTLNRVTGAKTHELVTRLPDILCGESFLSPSGEKPLLIFNDTKVRKARLSGRREQTGARTEFLLLENKSGVVWKALVKRARRKKTGGVYVFFDKNGAQMAKAVVSGFEGDFPLLEFDRIVDDSWLEKYGSVPLPPYIKRKDIPADSERYQTVYARQTGSAAAPTAGLHFTREILEKTVSCGIDSAFVTLHIGLGTFLPVRSVNMEDHVMHTEQFVITEESALLIENAMARKRKIIAVGTTSLRALESAFSSERIKRGMQSTSIFIYPGYRFKAVDALFTNLHTPLSTLLMLVSAFADGVFSGRDLILESYAEAIREGYRFFSYGDAMLIY
ncbi:MAG: tRNA preQ1(34) S-adenosylmethionine ribosyltransferase-isomerase QueA [Treponema sp.]|jgi:S-adenosylmethionine:tRNA ribosyltransferase-isomerase|nr:tRNA preQ1(34) S-adenosylmethionine ribosyltransferase-isomerase QueA [Treponema sp.]